MYKRQTVIKLLLVVILFIFTSFCSESFESYYSTYEDAVKDGAIKRGWIPPIVPETARNIYEKHNLDTNNVWIRFETSATDIDVMFKNLKVVNSINLKNEYYQTTFSGDYPQDWWISKTVGADSLMIGIYDYKGDCLSDGEARSGYFFFDGEKNYVFYIN